MNQLQIANLQSLVLSPVPSYEYGRVLITPSSGLLAVA